MAQVHHKILVVMQSVWEGRGGKGRGGEGRGGEGRGGEGRGGEGRGGEGRGGKGREGKGREGRGREGRGGEGRGGEGRGGEGRGREGEGRGGEMRMGGSEAAVDAILNLSQQHTRRSTEIRTRLVWSLAYIHVTPCTCLFWGESNNNPIVVETHNVIMILSLKVVAYMYGI